MATRSRGVSWQAVDDVYAAPVLAKPRPAQDQREGEWTVAHNRFSTVTASTIGAELSLPLINSSRSIRSLRRRELTSLASAQIFQLFGEQHQGATQSSLHCLGRDAKDFRHFRLHQSLDAHQVEHFTLLVRKRVDSFEHALTVGCQHRLAAGLCRHQDFAQFHRDRLLI